MAPGKLLMFAITFDNETAVYHTGDNVSGRFVVVLSAPISLRCIKICFKGLAEVKWDEASGLNEEDYEANEVYFDKTEVLFGTCNSKSKTTLDAGRHEFKFSYKLTGILPSSFSGEHGNVHYLVEARIVKPWKLDGVFQAKFTVKSILDLNNEGFEFRTESVLTGCKLMQFCCCGSGEVTATMKLNKRCFVPEETVFINARIVNNSISDVLYTSAQLFQRVEYFGRCAEFLSSHKLKSKFDTLVITKVGRSNVIPAGTTGKWSNVSLVIPRALPPSRLVGCNIINISYVLQFSVKTVYGMVSIVTELLIGTVPVHPALCAATQHDVITRQPTVQSEYNNQCSVGDTANDRCPPLYDDCVHGAAATNVGDTGNSTCIGRQSTHEPDLMIPDVPAVGRLSSHSQQQQQQQDEEEAAAEVHITRPSVHQKQTD